MTEWVYGIMKPQGQHCVEYADWFCEKERELIQRAAELLAEYRTDRHAEGYGSERIDQWLKDAGVEK